jgi:hypothetical protein
MKVGDLPLFHEKGYYKWSADGGTKVAKKELRDEAWHPTQVVRACIEFIPCRCCRTLTIRSDRRYIRQRYSVVIDPVSPCPAW